MIQKKFIEFEEFYIKTVNSLTTATVDTNNKIIPIDLSSLKDKIKSFELDKGNWSDKNIEKLPELMAYIFALWSLQKPEHMQK